MKTIAVVVALALTGCASVSGSGRLTGENVAKLRPGVSRTDDVRALMGSPYRVEAFPRLEREVWTYRMVSEGLWPKNLYLQFSADGIVREVLVIDDPDSGIG